tara:strand:- start:474 stop:593 length:120 start_codon:yes stop_codon:yes gene_type:complete
MANLHCNGAGFFSGFGGTIHFNSELFYEVDNKALNLKTY